VTGAVPTAADGVRAAQESIDRGDAARLLQRLAEFGRSMNVNR
jgi:anthranilate phosphoribosyltransferase